MSIIYHLTVLGRFYHEFMMKKTYITKASLSPSVFGMLLQEMTIAFIRLQVTCSADTDETYLEAPCESPISALRL
jgi:hypothetical protein